MVIEVTMEFTGVTMEFTAVSMECSRVTIEFTRMTRKLTEMTISCLRSVDRASWGVLRAAGAAGVVKSSWVVTSMPDSVAIQFELRVGGRPLRATVEVPAGPTRPRALLPVLKELTERIVDLGVEAARAEGKTISCQKGCGACCRQLVPISEAEAHHISRLVAALPVARRGVLRGRFTAARQALARDGLIGPLTQAMAGRSEAPLRPLGERYFQLGVPCPFLEDGACSIHPDRPLACREYLVTSPASECASPTPERVAVVPLAAKVSSAAAALDGPGPAGRRRWVALTLALDWAERHEEPAPRRTGAELLRELVDRMTPAALPRNPV